MPGNRAPIFGAAAIAAAALAFLARPAVAASAAWDGAPNPHDSAHLVLAWPGGFRDAGGNPVKPVSDAESKASRAVALSAAPLTQRLRIRHPGDYVLWLHVRHEGAVKVELLRDGKPAAAATVGSGTGGAGAGGPEGFRLYLDQAVQNTPDGKSLAQVKGHWSGEARAEAALDAGGNDDVLDNLVADLKGRTGSPFVSAHRLEAKAAGAPYTWWKAFRCRLESGAVDLRLALDGQAEKPPLVDCAFLSTAADTNLVYPYAGDFATEPGSYVRFRVDEAPAAGVALTARMALHHDPFGAGPWLFNPDGYGASGSAAHKETGYTRWYRLQDGGGDFSPAYGGSEVSLSIGVSPLAGSRGATQFAGYPHQDAVVRELDWHEPDGLQLSMTLDYDRFPERLRTFRDHERIHYRWALEANGEQLFPLTPTDDINFSNVSGGAGGSAQDYMYKVFRLLGVNAVGASDPLVFRQYYGGDLTGGHYWPPSFMPYDEEAARRQYADYYRDYFKAETYRHTRVFQIADEPGEIGRDRMSAPLWRYVEDAGGARWVDECGDSSMYTRATNHHDCALEGRIRVTGNNLTLRVAADASPEPLSYGFWSFGFFRSDDPNNLYFGRVAGGQQVERKGVKHPACGIPQGPIAFKILHEGTRASLLLNGQMISTLDGVPARGAFGIEGPNKAVFDLRIRPLTDGEKIGTPGGAASLEAAGENDLVADIVADIGQAAAEPAKPLKRLVEEDWVFGGGVPAAHKGFRAWAAARGAAPGLFGKPSWDDVTMLTIQALARTPEERRLYTWSRRYSGWLTAKMFAMSAEAIRAAAPNPKMAGFVALSGHALYMGSTAMPLDMFALADLGAASGMLAGVSDAMSYGGWRWDGHQSVAYSVAPYNAGYRRYGAPPAGFPMMHCDWPSLLRSYTMLANQVKFISYFWYGPSYAGTEWYWSEGRGSYDAVARTCNRVSAAPDIIGPGALRPARVALLYAHATEYWSGAHSYADKRATFIGLSHDYYQPELVTEDQVAAGALDHYDALYVLEPNVARSVQDTIGAWVRAGGLLWACANALQRDEYDEPADLLADLAGLRRTEPAAGGEKKPAAVMSPVAGEAEFAPHPVRPAPVRVEAEGARVRARYDDGAPAWVEKGLGAGRVVYLGHRPGLTYSARSLVLGGFENVWADGPRVPLTQPLLEKGVPRELALSEPVIVATPLSTPAGTAVVLYNIRPYEVRNLEIDLAEPAPPHSVQAFAGFALTNLPSRFEAGRCRITLPSLGQDEGQIVIVRRTPPPPDPRPAALRTLAEQDLQASDWRGVSAGAWMAGFHPEWGLADRLAPLLSHASPEVRRAAAESLGRLPGGESGPRLEAALGREKDPHARADMLAALLRLGHPAAVREAAAMLKDGDAFLRAQALELLAARAARDEAGAAEVRAAVPWTALQAMGLDELDARVFSAALRLYARLMPAEALALARELAGDTESSRTAGDEAPAARPRAGERLQALLEVPAVLDAYLAQGCPGGAEFLLLLAHRRTHPALAARVLENLPAVKNVGSFLAQQEPGFARALFAAREQLSPGMRGYVYVLLEKVFKAHLGYDEAAWAAWLAAHPEPT